MSKTTIATIEGRPVTWDGSVLEWTANLAIDADGSPRAYGPNNSGLDHIDNAGGPGNWYGIVVDGAGKPVVQGPNDPRPGFYVSPTTYNHRQYGQRDPRRYVDSEAVPYAVVPGNLRKKVGPVVMGCRALVTNIKTGVTVECVVADCGPSKKVGEGSIKLARMLGINPHARHGGTDQDVIRYQLFPGVPALVDGVQYELQRA